MVCARDAGLATAEAEAKLGVEGAEFKARAEDVMHATKLSIEAAISRALASAELWAPGAAVEKTISKLVQDVAIAVEKALFLAFQSFNNAKCNIVPPIIEVCSHIDVILLQISSPAMMLWSRRGYTKHAYTKSKGASRWDEQFDLRKHDLSGFSRSISMVQ